MISLHLIFIIHSDPVDVTLALLLKSFDIVPGLGDAVVKVLLDGPPVILALNSPVYELRLLL